MSFTPDLLATMAAKQEKSFAIVQEAAKAAKINFNVQLKTDKADDKIQDFKDALFTLVMLRARNFMKETGLNYAPVDISLTLGGKEKSGLGILTIIPKVNQSTWDTNGDLQLEPLVDFLSSRDLPCE